MGRTTRPQRVRTRTPRSPCPPELLEDFDKEPDQEGEESSVVPPPGLLKQKSLASSSALVGGLAVVLMDHSKREGRSMDLPAFVDGAERHPVRLLVNGFGADRVHVISFIAIAMSVLYRDELTRLGAFRGISGLSPARIATSGLSWSNTISPSLWRTSGTSRGPSMKRRSVALQRCRPWHLTPTLGPHGPDNF